MRHWTGSADLDLQKCLVVLRFGDAREHTGEVNGVCAVRVGERELLASASDDETVHLWDPATSQALHVIPVHYAAHRLAWFNHGYLVVALSAGLLAVNLIGR